VSPAETIRYAKKGRSFRFLATQAHGIETLALHSLYKAALQKDLELCFTVFVYKNNILRDVGDEGQPKERTPEEKAELLRLATMMGAASRVDAQKMIENYA